jgi:thiamine-monophosphate kinase
VKLKDLGEFGFLARMREWMAARGSSQSAVVGIGDDAAVVQVTEGARLVAAADALVEGVHFRLDWSSPSDVGWKAVAVNLSDLAAMGAEARWVLVTLCAPPDTKVDTLRGLFDGMDEACSSHGAELVGGDTVASSELILSVTALGEVSGDPLTRSGARTGDALAVTGPLGLAAAGVKLLREGVREDDECIAAHRRPKPRLREGLALRKAGVHAAIDISDGLASDASHLAEASGVGVEIDAASLPMAPEVAEAAATHGWEAEDLVLNGGEDYELLVAVPPESSPDGIVVVGRVVPDVGAWLVRDGKREPLGGGWDHFK